MVYCYPRTAQPGVPGPEGWNEIPGARGCTPQSCAFRDHFEELTQHGVSHVFGLSTQDTDYQREAAERLALPFPSCRIKGWNWRGRCACPPSR